MQELLWNGDELEVLEPEWFRNEVAKTIERMNNLYKK
jgi:predicted DNA-binding transcriptional regulator YafY